MIYAWLLIPVLVGFAYFLWHEKYPALGERLGVKIEPFMKFLGYCLGVLAIIVLLWGMI